MARAKLGDMLSVVETATSAPIPETPAEQPSEATSLAAAPDPKPQPAPAKEPVKRTPPAKPTSKKTAPSATGPRYLELIRKEARFTDDQLEALNVLTRQLNKARRGSGERITDNTLIRVAVDLLLQQRDQLAGTTEDELRKSVSL